MKKNKNSISSVSTAVESRPEVIIRVEADADAARISAVLEACGFSVVRELDEGEALPRLAWAVEKLSTRFGLTEREVEILSGVLEGFDNKSIAQTLGISSATAKWHLSNVFKKTGSKNRESLLRVALQIDDGGRI